MRKSRILFVTSLAILLARCGCAFALDPSLDVSQYAHTSWRVRDGFTKEGINAMVQTPDGYLWLGTAFGLLRFDGMRTVPWQPPAGVQLASNDILTLLSTRDGTLWIGTRKGLVSWKNGELTQYPELATQSFTALLEARDGTLWTGGYADNGAGLCAIRSGNVQCYGDGNLGPAVLALYEDSKQNLWLGVMKGLWRWKPSRPEFFSLPDERSGVLCFAEDARGTVLFGSHAGIRRLLNGRAEPYPSGPAQQSQIVRLARDPEGGLWAGTVDRGIVHIHQGRTDAFSQVNGLSGDLIHQFFQDREGSMWVATGDGLDRFRTHPITTFTARQGLSGSTAFSLLAAKDDSIWIGTLNGLNQWERGEISRFGSRGYGKLNGEAPQSLFQDSSGRMWVSTQREFGYLQNNRFVPVAGFPGGHVFSVAEPLPGHLWISSVEYGLFHLAHGTVVQRIPWTTLGRPADYAVVLLADPSQQGLWMGFHHGGVAYFENGQIRKSYSAADGLGGGRVNGLRFGLRGALWVATDGGLSRVKEGQVATMTSKNGLPCDGAHWTIEDDDHAIWLNMPCGLVRLTRSEMDRWAADPRVIVKTTVFDSYDGMRSHANGGGYMMTVTKTSDGKIWFVPWDGVSVIDPHNLHENKLPPPVHIEQVTADDKPFDATNGMKLPPRNHYLVIDYTALSLVAPEKVRFRYKLEGFDKDWREVGNIRQVQYTNLPPKHYRFRVIACNNSGVWNETGETLEFVVPPMWYQTNWFYAACVAVFFAMLWGIYDLRVRQLAHQFNVRLEERVAERTRIARELHDTLLQSFQALLPLLQAGINMFGSRPADALRTFEKAADHASQAIAEGRDAIQGMRMSTVEKNDLAVAIRTLGEELASAAKPPSPNFNVVVEGTSRNLHPILRDEVYRLTTEALRNAFRHASAQNVEVEIRYDEKYFRLRVRDDGKGIPSDVLSGDGREGHYGLPGMRERAKLVGGKLTIWTEVDGGTEIELNIPGARAFVKSARPFWYFGKRSATETDQKEPIERE